MEAGRPGRLRARWLLGLSRQRARPFCFGQPLLDPPRWVVLDGKGIDCAAALVCPGAFVLVPYESGTLQQCDGGERHIVGLGDHTRLILH